MSGTSARPAVFLDRDGTLVDELGFLADPDELRLLPGAAAAVRRLNEAGVWVGLVTNQSGVARGLLDEARLASIHARLAELLAAGGARLDAVRYCPHHPTEGAAPYRGPCSCRKPAPGMILGLADEHGLSLERSFAIGDAVRDLEAGRRAGVPNLVLVLTGKGERERGRLPESLRDLVRVEPDLDAAVDLVLAASTGPGSVREDPR